MRNAIGASPSRWRRRPGKPGAIRARCASSRSPRRSACRVWRRRWPPAPGTSGRTDAIKKKAGECPQARWHFIGNVQSRRIPDIVQCASLVHSLYQERHVARIDEAARRLGKVQDVLLEVNVSGEESKSGVAPGQAGALLRACEPFANVRVRGLMTMAPQGDKAVAHACFEDLARLHARLRDGLDAQRADAFDELSMGMSEDWQEAVFAGATIVRIGRAVFDDAFDEADR